MLIDHLQLEVVKTNIAKSNLKEAYTTSTGESSSLILKNGKYGLLFKTSNYNELSKKIIDVYKNKKKYNKMSISGFKSLDRFDYNLNCKKYLKIVNKSLKI